MGVEGRSDPDSAPSMARRSDGLPDVDFELEPLERIARRPPPRDSLSSNSAVDVGHRLAGLCADVSLVDGFRDRRCSRSRRRNRLVPADSFNTQASRKDRAMPAKLRRIVIGAGFAADFRSFSAAAERPGNKWDIGLPAGEPKALAAGTVPTVA